jgi:hypothetical protein
MADMKQQEMIDQRKKQEVDQCKQVSEPTIAFLQKESAMYSGFSGALWRLRTMDPFALRREDLNAKLIVERAKVQACLAGTEERAKEAVLGKPEKK